MKDAFKQAIQVRDQALEEAARVAELLGDCRTGARIRSRKCGSPWEPPTSRVLLDAMGLVWDQTDIWNMVEGI